MNIYKISATALWISCALSISAVINTSVMAYDTSTEQYHLDPSDIDLASFPSIILPFKNQFFLYDFDAIQFDLGSFLYTNAPELIDKKELIGHWAGYYSVNPKIILTLMEMQSQLISSPTEQAFNRPLGSLSTQQGFAAQLQDVLAQLSQRFYTYEELQLKNKQQQSTEAVNAATFALLGMSNQKLLDQQTPLDIETNSLLELDHFIDQLSLLFGHNEKDLLVLTAIKEGTTLVTATAGKPPIPQNLPPQNMLQMPWRIDYSWKSNGAHSHTGSGYPLSSIDVSYNWPRWGRTTYSVTASHGGTVNVLSRCQIRVTNDNGWATNYYHMDKISMSSGQYVNANTILGVYASNRSTALCQGGSSTGPHLHFSLL